MPPPHQCRASGDPNVWRTFAAAVLMATAVAAALAATASVSAAGQDASRVVDEAARAMGIAGLSSITFTGSAATGNFGQSRTISFGLASTAIRNYTRTIDFTHAGVARHRRHAAAGRSADGRRRRAGDARRLRPVHHAGQRRRGRSSC